MYFPSALIIRQFCGCECSRYALDLCDTRSRYIHLTTPKLPVCHPDFRLGSISLHERQHGCTFLLLFFLRCFHFFACYTVCVQLVVFAACNLLRFPLLRAYGSRPATRGIRLGRRFGAIGGFRGFGVASNTTRAISSLLHPT